MQNNNRAAAHYTGPDVFVQIYRNADRKWTEVHSGVLRKGNWRQADATKPKDLQGAHNKSRGNFQQMTLSSVGV